MEVVMIGPKWGNRDLAAAFEDTFGMPMDKYTEHNLDFQ